MKVPDSSSQFQEKKGIHQLAPRTADEASCQTASAVSSFLQPMFSEVYSSLAKGTTDPIPVLLLAGSGMRGLNPEAYNTLYESITQCVNDKFDGKFEVRGCTKVFEKGQGVENDQKFIDHVDVICRFITMSTKCELSHFPPDKIEYWLIR